MLAETEIEALWKAVLEHQSVYYVAKRCKVAPATVRKYRRLRAWDARLQQIQAKACALADRQVAEQRAKALMKYHALNMELLDALIEQLEAGHVWLFKAGLLGILEAVHGAVFSIDSLVDVGYYLEADLIEEVVRKAQELWIHSSCLFVSTHGAE
jgi:hypothetical protein